MRAILLPLHIVSSLGILATTSAEAANLLVNGSFETWSGGYTPSNQPDRIFNDLTLSVLRLTAGPLALTSANRSGTDEAVTADGRRCC